MELYRKMRKASGKVLPRRFHCYCIGAAKTATTSVSAMFEDNYDALHEADIVTTNRNIINYLEGEISIDGICEYLKNRDRDVNVELESTHSLVYVIEHLVALFPKAQFLITVRDPMRWLRSRLNFHYQKDPPEWREYRDYFWTNRAGSFAPEEKILEENGICPLSVYLMQYADHYQRVFNAIPKERSLVIKTNELSERIPAIAEFLKIGPTSLNPKRVNAEDSKAAFIDQLDDNFVRSSIWAHCKPLIQEYFPEQEAFYTVDIAK